MITTNIHLQRKMFRRFELKNKDFYCVCGFDNKNPLIKLCFCDANLWVPAKDIFDIGNGVIEEITKIQEEKIINIKQEELIKKIILN